MKNGIPLTKKMSAVKNTIFLRLAISLVILIRSEATVVCLPWTDLPFRALMSFPHITWVVSIFQTNTLQFLIWLFFIGHLNYAFDGHNSLAYSFRDAFAPLASRLVNDFIFSSTLFICTRFFVSSGQNTWRPDLCILTYMSGSADVSWCTINFWSSLSYVTQSCLIIFFIDMILAIASLL